MAVHHTCILGKSFCLPALDCHWYTRSWAFHITNDAYRSHSNALGMLWVAWTTQVRCYFAFFESGAYTDFLQPATPPLLVSSWYCHCLSCCPCHHCLRYHHHFHCEPSCPQSWWNHLISNLDSSKNEFSTYTSVNWWCHAPNMFGTVNMEHTIDSRLSWSEWWVWPT